MDNTPCVTVVDGHVTTENNDPKDSAEPSGIGESRSRIALPWRMRQAIRIKVTGSGDDKTHEYQVIPPFRVGYGKGCEVPLGGADGPDTLFEFSPVTRPVRLSTPVRDDLRTNDIQISVDGIPLSGNKLDLESGSVVDIRDLEGRRQVQLTVDVPERFSNLLLSLFVLLLVTLVALAGYGLYTYQNLQLAQQRISETESGLMAQHTRIENALELFRNQQLAVESTFHEFENAQRAKLFQLRAEFSERLRDITIEAKGNLSRISAEDVQAREALAANTEGRIEQLRLEFTEKLFNSLEKLKQAQEELLLRNAQRLDSLEIEGDLFKSILADSHNAVVFIRTSYMMEFAATGEHTTQEAVGTGFTIGSSGLTLAPQHVMKPWLYDKNVLSMQSIGFVKVFPETAVHTIWTAQQQVVKPDLEPFQYLTDDAFSTDNSHSAVLLLYAPETKTAPEQVSTPFGMVTIQEPIAGPTDVTVLQLIDANRTFSTLTIETDLNTVEPLDEVLLLGFPLARLKNGRSIPQAVKGFVRHLTSNLLELDSTLLPGNSGGPVLNRDGRVIGMAIATLGSESYGAAVPAGELTKAISNAEIAVNDLKQELIDRGCTPGALNGQADLQLWQSLRNPECEQSPVNGPRNN